MLVLRKLIGLFLSIMSIDLPALLLRQIFPMITFYREKVSQRSDEKLLLSFFYSIYQCLGHP